MPWVCGADGFKSSWVVASYNLVTHEFESEVVGSFSDLLSLRRDPKFLCVDIPIGLPSHPVTGGRQCEIESRRVLGKRGCTVFPSLCRPVVHDGQSSYPDANQKSKDQYGVGFSKQAWAIRPKLAEADRCMTPQLQKRVFEVHPEVSFWAMAGQPIQSKKKSLNGRDERRNALEKAGFPSAFLQRPISVSYVPHDDFLDACAALWTAKRLQRGIAARFPSEMISDERGLDQAIWF